MFMIFMWLSNSVWAAYRLKRFELSFSYLSGCDLSAPNEMKVSNRVQKFWQPFYRRCQEQGIEFQRPYNHLINSLVEMQCLIQHSSRRLLVSFFKVASIVFVLEVITVFYLLDEVKVSSTVYFCWCLWNFFGALIYVGLARRCWRFNYFCGFDLDAFEHLFHLYFFKTYMHRDSDHFKKFIVHLKRSGRSQVDFCQVYVKGILIEKLQLIRVKDRSINIYLNCLELALLVPMLFYVAQFALQVNRSL